MALYNTKIAGMEQREEIFTKLQEADAYVQANYIGSIDNNTLITEILSGYAKGTGDSYAKYYTAEENYQEMLWQQGKVITAGIRAERDESGYIKVTGIYPNSSAAVQKIVEGDTISSIEGQNVLSIGADAALKQLNGDEGTRLNITVISNGTSRDVRLIRQSVEVITASGNVYNGYGFIKITGLSDLTSGQFTKLADNFIKQGVKGFIIDVRGLEGSLIQPVSEILNRICSASVVANAEYNDGHRTAIIETDNSQSIDLPIAVITDAGTSAMGELLTAVLKDFKAAKIIGTSTHGMSLIQQIHQFKDGSAMRLSYARVSSMGGTNFNGTGIVPEFLVENVPNQPPPDTEHLDETADLQIKKAVEVLDSGNQQ
jgi:carboxyl-terminal processing protease